MSLDSQNIDLDKKTLDSEKKIKELEKGIISIFKIKIQDLEALYTFKKGKNEEEFRETLSGELERLKIEITEGSIESFSKKILEVNELREETRKGIENLMSDLINLNSIENIFFKKYSLNYSQETIKKIESPKNIIDNLLGIGVGIIETTYIVGKITYDLVKGILYIPIDIYRILTGKAIYENFKNI